MYCRSAAANDLILVGVDSGQHSLFYNSFPFGLNFKPRFGRHFMTNLSHVLGMLTPRSGEDLISVLLLDQALLAVVSGLPRYLTDLKSGRKCHSVVSNSL